MKFYRTPILVFGIVLPLLLAAVVIGASHYFKSWVTGSYDEKVSHYTSYDQTRRGALATEQEINSKRPHVERWQALLAEDAASAVSSTLNSITQQLPANEIEQTGFDPRGIPSGFGLASAHKSSEIRISFRGSFRTMQKAFLELETRMPHLQLQDLSIAPSSGQSSIQQYNVTYTAWEN